MIAHLIEKNGQYYCSECMMRQNLDNNTCKFCGRVFTNWEELMHQIFLNTQIKEEKVPK